MRTRKTRKRRLAVAAIFALTVAVTAPFLAPSAGAVVANPGVLDVSMNLTMSTPNFTIAGMRTTGLGAATLEKNGVVNIPKSSLTFDPVVVRVDLPQPPASPPSTDPANPTTTQAPNPAPTTATVQAVAMSNFSGGLDPGTGAAFIVGDIEELWTQAGTMTNCVVGPFRVAARTNAPGAIGYSAKTGTVSMVDPDFTLDAVPASAPGCGGLEGAVNTALALPVTTTTTTTTSGSNPTTTTTIPLDAKPPVPSVVVSLTFMPAPRAVTLAPVKRPHPPGHPSPPPVVAPRPPSFTPLPSVVSPQPSQPSRPVHHRTRRTSTRRRSTGNSDQSSGTKRRIGGGWTTRRTPHRAVHSRPVRTKAATPKKRAAATGTAGQKLNFTNAAFIKRPQSALATGLDLLGLLGLLGFSSLALWLVTTELSEFSAVSRRLRTHRIAGITK